MTHSLNELSPDEQAYVESFLLREKKERYLYLLAQNRSRILTRLHHDHLKDIDPRWIVQRGIRSAAEVIAELKKLGAANHCYCISTIKDLDGAHLRLDEAIDAIHGWGMGSILSCVPGQLAWYCGEYADENVILFRSKAPNS